MLKQRAVSLSLASVALFSAQILLADVKAGVDAWSNGDYQAAVKQWRDPAAKGDPDAQFNMGQAYKLGRGIKQDLNMAGEWYARAARQGHLQAADSLGHLYHYQGKVAQALPLLEASSQRGEPRSQYLLATELFNGVNIAKDWVRAYALMTRASSAGLAPASRSLAEMDKYIPLGERQQGVALAAEIERSSAQMRTAQVNGFPINTKPPAPVVKSVDVPPSASNSMPGFPGDIPPVAAPDKATPTPKPVAATKPAKPATSGSWRIQLGAFGSEANAARLWEGLEAKVSGLAAYTPYLVNAGPVTRLQAGQFASRAAAEAMCGKVKAAVSGQACIVAAP
jgi:cell division septation protein DedD